MAATGETVTYGELDRRANQGAHLLRALGVDEGAEVSVVHRGVFGTRDPLALRIGRMTIALRRVHARAIEVEPA